MLECRGSSARVVARCYVPADNSTIEPWRETNRRGMEALDRGTGIHSSSKRIENVELLSSASEVGVRETYRVCTLERKPS